MFAAVAWADARASSRGVWKLYDSLKFTSAPPQDFSTQTVKFAPKDPPNFSAESLKLTSFARRRNVGRHVGLLDNSNEPMR
eukprot:5959059-Amphidinium_carterae.1